MTPGVVESGTRLFLLLMLVVVAFSGVAARLRIPYPIVLVIAGLVLALVPGMPRVDLAPDVVFLIVLPPLLYSGAWTTSWRDFRYHAASILSLAVGLVAFTVFAVAAVAPFLFHGFDWRLGILLGAIVAPTDAIAATSIGRRVGLSRDIVTKVEGESLVNDATGLLALRLAMAMILTGEVPTVWEAIGRFAYLSGVGIAVGLLFGAVLTEVHRRLDDAPMEIALSVMTPYAAYLAAEQVGGSGVLAVITAGLYLSRRSHGFFSPEVRTDATAVWNAITFVLNGFVFVGIGLQLRYVLPDGDPLPLRGVVLDCVVFGALLVLLRLVWGPIGAWLATMFRRRVLRQQVAMPGGRELLVVSWAGMRGVISLAAALSIPLTLPGGAPFPQRGFMLLLTFGAILLSLIVQGLTLPAFARALGLAAASTPDEQRRLHRSILEATVAYLDERRRRDRPEAGGVYDDLVQHYRRQLASLTGSERDDDAAEHARYREVSRDVIAMQREMLQRLKRERRYDAEVLREFERHLDVAEMALRNRA